MAIELNDVRALAEPLRQYNFEFYIPRVPGNGGDPEELRLIVTNATLPGFQSNLFDTNYGGWTIHHAGRREFTSPVSIDFVETAQLHAVKALKAWHELQWHPQTGVQVDEGEYKTEAHLRLLRHDKTLLATAKLMGVMIESVSDVTFDTAGDDVVTVSASFSYDWWELELA